MLLLANSLMLAKLELLTATVVPFTLVAVSGLVPAPVVRAAVGTLLFFYVFIFFTGVAAVLITI